MSEMKIRHFIIYSFLLMALTAGHKGWAQNTSFHGAWKVDVAMTLDIMKEELKTLYDSLPAEAKVRARQSLVDRKFIFSGNNEVKVLWNAGGVSRAQLGTWQHLPEQKEIHITIEGITTEFRYEFKNPVALVLNHKVPRGLFSGMFLQKSN